MTKKIKAEGLKTFKQPSKKEEISEKEFEALAYAVALKTLKKYVAKNGRASLDVFGNVVESCKIKNT